MDIHVDHPERSTDFYGQPTMPNILLAGTQLLAVDFLERCMRDMEPLAALTGGAGTGKTTALNTALARQESAGDRVIRVNNFVAGPLSLHRVLAASIGVADAGELSAEELEPVLRKALADIGQAEPPILAVDDAQSLLPETLRYLCLLGGLREAGQPLFRILLVGRPGFTVRQPVPVHFTLEAMQPNAAREIIEHGLAAAGVMATGEKIRDLVHGAQGNLRTLGSLLQAYIEEARRSGGGRRRMTAVADAGMAGVIRHKARPARRRSSAGAWLVIPALLVVGAAGAAIVYHDGAGARHDDTPAAAVPAPPVGSKAAASSAVPPAAPPAVPHSMAANVPPTNVLPPPSEAVSPAIPAPAGPASLPPPAHSASAGAGGTAIQAPMVPSSIKPPKPAPAPPAVAAAPTAAVTPPAIPALPRPPPNQAPDPQPQPSGQASVPPSAPVQQAAHFRVYNISACHHGVCPRWSVTDLDQRSRFVAAFDLSALHLDRDTVRRLREGAVDIIVDGSVTHGGPDGRTLVAGTLQGIAPHHGLLHPSSSEPVDLAAPPQTQSPPPGFLALPASNPSAAPLPLTPSQ